MCRAASAAQPGGLALGGQPVGGHGREDDHVRLGGALAAGPIDVPQPLDPRALGDLRTAVGWERKRQPSASPVSGGGSSISASKLSSVSAMASATSPPGATARRAEAKKPLALGQQLDRLHRHGDEREDALAGVEGRGVGDDGAHRQAVGALGQRGQQVRVDVERRDLVAGAGEVERHAPGAGADVEHRAAGLVRQLAPQRQVGGVGAALDVVPDHLGVHRQYSSWPRRLSTSLSSSSAV